MHIAVNVIIEFIQTVLSRASGQKSSAHSVRFCPLARDSTSQENIWIPVLTELRRHLLDPG